ncbi:hypothetical protein [Paraglaciecola sp. L3A3]|uniref:hypothetical protein n=1 Tax=Paraglaciecola sp. L3A3 TaxID=2686358 RepID=UPI00131D3615|nr:hypothetical protein [Paraglaciecola sp. L3A3]
MSFQQIIPSIKRELWENEKSILWLPTAIAGLMFLVTVSSWLLVPSFKVVGINSGSAGIDLSLFFTGMLFVALLFIAIWVQWHYFVSCLHDDRRDKSIFFWRSLPVSDALTVAIKLFVGAIIIPGAAILISMVFSLVLALIVVVSAIFGFDASVDFEWAKILKEFTYLAYTLLNFLLYTLWIFPVYAWLMLASAFAKKAPSAWVILPVIILLMIEAFAVDYLGIGSRFLFESIKDYFSFEVGQGESSMLHLSILQNTKLDTLPNLLLAKINLIPTLLGCGFMYLTYWLRVNRSQE